MQVCSYPIFKTANPIKSLLMFSSKRLLSEIFSLKLKSKSELISRSRTSVPNGSTYRPVRTVDHWFFIYDKLTILIDRMNLSEDYFSKILNRSRILSNTHNKLQTTKLWIKYVVAIMWHTKYVGGQKILIFGRAVLTSGECFSTPFPLPFRWHLCP